MTSLGRRWYLVLVGLVATSGLALLAYSAVPVSYDARASMVLLPPATSVTEGGNPYLYLSGLGQALDILSRRLDSDSIRSKIEDDTVSGTYVAAPDVTTSGPILSVEGSGNSEKAALEMMDGVVEAVPLALASLQTELDVPEYSRITAMTITTDTEATLDQKTRLQATLMLAGAGMAATILLTGFIDGRLMARRIRLAAAPKPIERPTRRRKTERPPSIDMAPEDGEARTDIETSVKRDVSTPDQFFAPRR